MPRESPSNKKWLSSTTLNTFIEESAVNLIIKSKPVNWKATTGSYQLPGFFGSYQLTGFLGTNTTSIIIIGYFKVNLHTAVLYYTLNIFILNKRWFIKQCFQKILAHPVRQIWKYQKNPYQSMYGPTHCVCWVKHKFEPVDNWFL